MAKTFELKDGSNNVLVPREKIHGVVFQTSITEYNTMGTLNTISLIMYFISFLLCLSFGFYSKTKAQPKLRQLPACT